MPDREKVRGGLLAIKTYLNSQAIEAKGEIVREAFMESARNIDDALSLLKEHEVRELTIEEWRKWKENPRRDPICKLWENDTSPMWILSPEDVHEPALLMGKLKLFTGKPTFEQCKEVKWE